VTEGSEIVPLDSWLPFPWERDPSS